MHQGYGNWKNSRLSSGVSLLTLSQRAAAIPPMLNAAEDGPKPV